MRFMKIEVELVTGQHDWVARSSFANGTLTIEVNVNKAEGGLQRLPAIIAHEVSHELARRTVQVQSVREAMSKVIDAVVPINGKPH
jgi:copper chaperone CopZ